MSKLASRLFACLIALSLCLLPAVALADTTSSGSGSTSARTTSNSKALVSDHFVDEMGIINENTHSTIEKRAAEISEKYGIGIYILYTDDLDGKSAKNFSEGYYTSHNLGVGPGKDGILFVVATKSRDWIIVGHGKGAQPQEVEGGQLTQSQREKIGEDVVEELSDNHWSAAINTFLNDIDKTLAYYAENGKPLEYVDWFKIILLVLGALFIAAMIAALPVMKGIKDMKTAQLKSEAGDYIAQGSFELTRRNDVFVHTVTTSTKRSSSRSGGGSWSGGGFSGSSGKF